MFDWSAVPVFGAPSPALPQVIRPSAYALIHAAGKGLAIVRASTGLYLPGGGIVGAESPEDAACREAREECGLTILPGSWRRAAIDHITAEREATHYEKRTIFCDATVVAITEPVEPGHVLVWTDASEALVALTPPSHRWAVGEWMNRAIDKCAHGPQ